jgi:hypothetical protein
MTCTETALSLAAAFGLAATLGAQTTTSQPTTSMPDRDTIAVTGCLQRDARGAYTLANARIDPAAPAATTGATTAPTATTTTGATGTTTTGTTTATTAKSTAGPVASAALSTWRLGAIPADLNLDRHIGHKVQITGKETLSTAGSASATTATSTVTTGTTGTPESVVARKLDVKSLKMISATCP